MKILIAGNGDTAVHLAKMLSREDQDVIVMGTDMEILSDLDANYNVITTFGKANSVADQKKAGASGCDLFIAVTPYENRNIVAAEIAKWLGAKTTLARIDNLDLLEPEAKLQFRRLGIDKMVFPEYLAAREIVNSVDNVWIDSYYSLSSGELNVCSLKLRDGAPVIGMSLARFGAMTKNFHVSLIKRNGEAIIPGGAHTLERNDVAYFTSIPGYEKELASLCGKGNYKIKNVIISGAGKITGILSGLLSPAYNVKVIEPDREKCRAIVMRHPSVTVVNADFRDNSVLREEGIRDNCAFIALNDSSESNIVSATVAKHLGAVKTIAQVEDIQYIDEARSLDIDSVINKKLITSSRIYQILLDSYLDSPRCLAFEDSEVAEIVACESASVTRRKVRDLKLSADMTIAGLTRNGHGMLVNGDTQILPGDHVVVFCMRGSLRKVEKIFKS